MASFTETIVRTRQGILLGIGCNVYITKPVDYDNFAHAIRQLGLFFSVIQVPSPE